MSSAFRSFVIAIFPVSANPPRRTPAISYETTSVPHTLNGFTHFSSHRPDGKGAKKWAAGKDLRLFHPARWPRQRAASHSPARRIPRDAIMPATHSGPRSALAGDRNPPFDSSSGESFAPFAGFAVFRTIPSFASIFSRVYSST